MSDTGLGALQANNTLIRRQYIRRVLTEEWQAGQGVKTTRDLSRLLAERYGLKVDPSVLDNELRAMRAVKIEQAGHQGSFWVVPPWRLDMMNVTYYADQTTILNEVQHRLTGYALNSLILGERVIINTDRHCGRMIGEWITLLDWPEMGHVISHDHSIEILCLTPEYAELVHAKLIGDPGVLLDVQDS